MAAILLSEAEDFIFGRSDEGVAEACSRIDPTHGSQSASVGTRPVAIEIGSLAGRSALPRERQSGHLKAPWNRIQMSIGVQLSETTGYMPGIWRRESTSDQQRSDLVMHHAKELSCTDADTLRA